MATFPTLSADFNHPAPKKANPVNARFAAKVPVSPQVHPSASFAPFIASATVDTAPPIAPHPGINAAISPAVEIVLSTSFLFNGPVVKL